MSATQTHYLEYDPVRHVYWLDGEELISCTQVLKKVGVVNTDYFTEEHARRGTLVHAYTEFWDRGTPRGQGDTPSDFAPDPDVTAEELSVAAKYAAQYVKLRETIHFEILPEGIERKVFCPIHRYAARLDRHIRLRAPCLDIALAELKTNKSGYVPEWTGLQLAAQGHALAPGELFRRFVFVLTPERYIIHEYPVEEYVEDRDTFLSMVRTARWKRAHL